MHSQSNREPEFSGSDFDFVWSVDRSVTTLTENAAALETRMTIRQKFAWHEPFLTHEAELTFRLGDWSSGLVFSVEVLKNKNKLK